MWPAGTCCRPYKPQYNVIHLPQLSKACRCSLYDKLDNLFLQLYHRNWIHDFKASHWTTSQQCTLWALEFWIKSAQYQSQEQSAHYLLWHHTRSLRCMNLLLLSERNAETNNWHTERPFVHILVGKICMQCRQQMKTLLELNSETNASWQPTSVLWKSYDNSPLPSVTKDVQIRFV